MHVVFSGEYYEISRNVDYIISFRESRIIYCNELPESRFFFPSLFKRCFGSISNVFHRLPLFTDLKTD